MKRQITEFPSGILFTCTSYGLYINLKVLATKQIFLLEVLPSEENITMLHTYQENRLLWKTQGFMKETFVFTATFSPIYSS